MQIGGMKQAFTSQGIFRFFIVKETVHAEMQIHPGFARLDVGRRV
jgi:hypothetical protein